MENRSGEWGGVGYKPQRLKGDGDMGRWVGRVGVTAHLVNIFGLGRFG